MENTSNILTLWYPDTFRGKVQTIIGLLGAIPQWQAICLRAWSPPVYGSLSAGGEHLEEI